MVITYTTVFQDLTLLRFASNKGVNRKAMALPRLLWSGLVSFWKCAIAVRAMNCPFLLEMLLQEKPQWLQSFYLSRGHPESCIEETKQKHIWGNMPDYWEGKALQAWNKASSKRFPCVLWHTQPPATYNFKKRAKGRLQIYCILL